MNAKNKLTANCLLTFSHLYISYSSKTSLRITSPVLELQVCGYCLHIGQDQLINIALTISIGNC